MGKLLKPKGRRKPDDAKGSYRRAGPSLAGEIGGSLTAPGAACRYESAPRGRNVAVIGKVENMPTRGVPRDGMPHD